MDRSKRIQNPLKYNPDGTINRKNREKWVFSNRYMRLKNEYRELHRKNRKVRKQDHEGYVTHQTFIQRDYYLRGGFGSRNKK